MHGQLHLSLRLVALGTLNSGPLRLLSAAEEHSALLIALMVKVGLFKIPHPWPCLKDTWKIPRSRVWRRSTAVSPARRPVIRLPLTWHWDGHLEGGAASYKS